MKCRVRIPFTNQYVVLKGCRPGESKDSLLQSGKLHSNTSIKAKLEAIVSELANKPIRVYTSKDLKAILEVKLTFDQSALNQQIKELVELLNIQPIDTLEAIQKRFFSDANNLIFDVIMSDLVAATHAQRPNEIIVGLKFGATFEALIAALRAGELNIAHE